jgi:AcrR family transcriptional regulator
MPRKPDPTLRPAIVEKVTAHLRTTPVETVSVRSLGRVLGTSAYPIVYHFGSREALLDAVVEHLATKATRARLDPDAGVDDLEAYLVACYGGLDDADRELAARLAFELGSVESLGGQTQHRELHGVQVGVVAAWCMQHGVDGDQAERSASDAVLAARGVQWGFLLDHDEQRAEAALRRIAGRLAARTARVER